MTGKKFLVTVAAMVVAGVISQVIIMKLQAGKNEG